MDHVRCITKKQDEWYTPAYAVYPIVKHLAPFKRILCPFDTAESQFVQVLQREGFDVTHSHISDGTDFFDISDFSSIDAIVSNPPYTKKHDVVKRLFEIGKPFAMLLGDNGLFDSKDRFDMYSKNSFELLHLYPRINFIDGSEMKDARGGASPFQSVYVCHGVLKSPHVFEYLEK